MQIMIMYKPTVQVITGGTQPTVWIDDHPLAPCPSAPERSEMS